MVQVESLMASPESMNQYAKLEEEGEEAFNKGTLNGTQGKIEFKDGELKYITEKSEKALAGVSFVINPQTRVGIVGRTGAGKSSILVALFRLTELSNGVIEIDGQDIS